MQREELLFKLCYVVFKFRIYVHLQYVYKKNRTIMNVHVAEIYCINTNIIVMNNEKRNS